MANNVLDKSAMATLARLENELPHIAETLADLATGQKEMRQEQKELTRSIGELCIDLAVVAAQSKRNQDDIKAQHQDCKDLDTRVTSIQDDVAGLKVADRVTGGANALYTTIAGILLTVFGGN